MVRKTMTPLTISAISQADIQQFREWETALAQTQELETARRLSESMCDPLTADAEACWYQIWTKPLYANTKVAIGENYEAKLAPFMKGAWRFIGLDSSKYVVTREGKGVKAEAFTKQGSVLDEIEKTSGIAARRLLAIQGGAHLLRTLVQANGEAAPFAPLAVGKIGDIGQKLPAMIASLRDLLGFGWGHITVLHMLTDFGLAVKPDLHLVRTSRYLDLIDGLPAVDVPNERQALVIVAMAIAFVKAIYGPDATARDLRYFDKVVMEASRQELIPLLPRKRPDHGIAPSAGLPL